MLALVKRLLGWDAEPRPVRARGRADQVRRSQLPPTRGAAGAAARELSLAPRAADGFDPYNTGVFDRGASWDRISKKGH